MRVSFIFSPLCQHRKFRGLGFKVRRFPSKNWLCAKERQLATEPVKSVRIPKTTGTYNCKLEIGK